MDKLSFPVPEYLYAISCLKTGFCTSPIGDNMSLEKRTTLLDRISELERKLLQSIPPERTDPISGDLQLLGHLAEED